MTQGRSGKSANRARAALGAVLLLLAAAPAPAAAREARAVLSVTATVVPSCRIEHRPAARHQAEMACSTGAGAATSTVGGHGERPLAEAAAILGAPARGTRGIEFAAPVQALVAEAEIQGADEGRARYLTISY